MEPKTIARLAVAFIGGIVFSAGLAISGMTQPSKVVGFLDIGPHWDPSLAFVMVGAIGVFFVAHRIRLRLRAPVLAAEFSPIAKSRIDLRLVVGAGLFGIGWAIAGFCPGPAITSLGAGVS